MIGVVNVGAGWATGERHLPALKRDRRARLLGVVDVHPERARELARRHDLPHWGTSLDEAWVREARCAVIGVPPLEHGRVVADALGHGLDVLCEKPFIVPAERGRELADEAAAAGRVLAVVQNFQFSRGGQRLFELVGSGELGEIRSVHGFQLSNPARRLPVWAAALPGGLALDETPHLLYLLRRLLGGLELRGADGIVSDGAVRQLTATFDGERAFGSIVLSFEAAISEWQLVVSGDRATAAFDLFRDVLVVLPNDGRHGGREVLRSSGLAIGSHLSGVLRSGLSRVGGRLLYGNDIVVARFLDAVEGRAERIEWMSAADGIAVVSCLEEILARVGAAGLRDGSL